MRPLAALLLLSPLALAQSVSQLASSTEMAPPLTLAQALELAPANDPDGVLAEADLVAAERALARQLADPLALTVGDLEAERTVETAEATLASVRLTNRRETSSLFFAVLAADESKTLAARSLELVRADYQAAQIRAEVGAASGLELLQAQNSLGAAERAAQGVDEDSLLAYRELADAVGLSSTELLLRGLAPVLGEEPRVPTLAESLAWAQRENTDVAAARLTVRVAEAQRAASDTIFTARVELEAAADEVARAESELKASTRQLALLVRSTHGDLMGAVRALREAQATRSAYAQELDAQRTRLQAGAISESEFGEAEVTNLENAQAVQRARFDLRLAVLALEQSVVGSGAATGSAVPGNPVSEGGEGSAASADVGEITNDPEGTSGTSSTPATPDTSTNAADPDTAPNPSSPATPDDSAPADDTGTETAPPSP